MVEGPLSGQQARRRRAPALRAPRRPGPSPHAGAQHLRAGRSHHSAQELAGAAPARRHQGLHRAAAARRSRRRVCQRQIAGHPGFRYREVAEGARLSVADGDGGTAPAGTPRLDDVSVLGPHGFVRVAYADWGPIGAGRTVVCVHGMSRNGRDFDALAQRLAARGVRVVAPDLPGRGMSEWLERSEDYATPLYLSAMSALIARLGVREVDWVGSSPGGHIGMELAALPGTPIRRLVLNDFGARVAAAALHRIAAYLRVERTFGSVAEVEAYLREIHAHFGALTDAQWRHLAEHSAVATGDGRYRQHYDPAIARAFAWPLMLDITLWHVWDRVECPVLILRGEHSDLLLPGCVREMLRRGRAAAEGRVRAVDIPACGHAPSLMADDTIGLISDFLDDDAAVAGARAARPARRQSGWSTRSSPPAT